MAELLIITEADILKADVTSGIAGCGVYDAWIAITLCTTESAQVPR